MMNRHVLVLAAVFVSLPACTRAVPTVTNAPLTDAATATATVTNAPSTDAATATATNVPSTDGATAITTNAPSTDGATATATCNKEQFVACPTGETCARRGGKLIHSLPCYEHAADACTAAACTFGCDVYHGEPKEVHCASNAASTGNMKRCGGLANWACPENMTCQFGPNAEHGLDVSGECVPNPP